VGKIVISHRKPVVKAMRRRGKGERERSRNRGYERGGFGG
jgi:hypothetical protein